MPWSDLPEASTFERARRREAYRRLARAVTGDRDTSLPRLEDLTSRLRLFDQVYRGIRPIPVARIVGTAGRNHDFDRDFLPRRPEIRERWRRIEQLFERSGLPPIVVYKLGDDYWVVDGHHRVAVAKARKIDFIDAEVTELLPRRELPEGLDLGRVIFAEQERIFMEESGLAEARPHVRIEFSRPWGYVELLELVHAHGYRLSRERGALLEPPEVADDFYERVYRPAVEAIRVAGLPEVFPGATEADLFLLVHERRRALFAERGDVTVEQAVHEVARERPRGAARRVREAARRLRPPG